MSFGRARTKIGRTIRRLGMRKSRARRGNRFRFSGSDLLRCGMAGNGSYSFSPDMVDGISPLRVDTGETFWGSWDTDKELCLGLGGNIMSRRLGIIGW